MDTWNQISGTFLDQLIAAAEQVKDEDAAERKRGNSRGNAQTQADIDLVVRRCLDYVRTAYPEHADKIKHIHGGTQDGQGKETLKELRLPNAEDPSSQHGYARPDITLRAVGPTEDAPYDDRHINTVDTYADGRAKAREIESAVRAVVNQAYWTRGNGRAYLRMLAKRFRGETDEEFTRRAEDACKALMDDWITRLRNEVDIERNKVPPGEVEEP